MIYNRIDHKYSLRPVNYTIKSAITAFCLSFCLPAICNIANNLPIKNATSEQAVVNAFLNKLSDNNPDKSVKIDRIVIDAGHGGKDHGCGGFHSNEKHIVLDIAKKIKSKLREYHPELEVIMTREHDVFIPLYKRIEIANKNNADLFISIHCNSLDLKSVRGSETYVMGLHTADENLAVAKRENEVILMEQNYMNNYDGFDPNSDEGHIMLAMSQNEHLSKSINFADKLQQSFAQRTKLKNRGVKQAGFVVLKRATMPSVLIETGFISNKQDENYLLSTEGKTAVADAIVKAFTLYKRELDQEQNQYNDLSIASSSNSSYNEPIVSQPQRTTSQVTVQKAKPRMVQPHEINDPNHHKIISVTSVPVKPNPNSNSATQIIPRKSVVPPLGSKVYKVQIAASVNKPIDQQSKLWKQVNDIVIKKEENMYKYLTGTYDTIAEANNTKIRMREIGFKGAFIVAYQGEERVNP